MDQACVSAGALQDEDQNQNQNQSAAAPGGHALQNGAVQGN
jgi:hypothetical protein